VLASLNACLDQATLSIERARKYLIGGVALSEWPRVAGTADFFALVERLSRGVETAGDQLRMVMDEINRHAVKCVEIKPTDEYDDAPDDEGMTIPRIATKHRPEYAAGIERGWVEAHRPMLEQRLARMLRERTLQR
jgi:hypothetical protein